MPRLSRRSAVSRLALASLLAPLGPELVLAATTPRRGGTLTAIVQPEPVVLTAAVNTAAPTQFVSGNVFDGLVDYAFDLSLRPSLATSWEVAPDGKTITFHLRQGVLWHDGQPFTSADVKWSLENVWQTIHPRNKSIYKNVETVDVPDEHTVVLRLKAPSLAIMSTLNASGATILPRHLYEGTDILTNPYNNKPIGTGPFVFKEWKKGEYILLERNPHYWDQDKPYLDKLIFKVVPDAAARAAALEKGEAQYAILSPVPLREAERLGKLPQLRIETRGYEWLSPVFYLDFNIDNPYLKDVKVRQALAHAIDLQAIAKIVWYGFAVPAISPVPSTVPFFHNPDVPRYAFDPARAETLLDEAGLKRGANGVRFKLTHDFLPYGDDFKRTGDYLKQALKRVGIEVDIRAQDTASFIKRVYADRDFDVSSSWNGAFPDPQMGITRIYWSGWVGSGTPWTNASGYKNPLVDDLIDQAAISPDAKARAELFRKFQTVVQTDLPTLPLAELRFFTLHAANLRDLTQQGDQVYASVKNAWFDTSAE
ncbi:peptide/nickel transport system substrate-binding protein [Arboricoccus pini]|uniref:Peptide/nickel transport system substrate-binding protein n=1 Tax=Arboricoccus pini TaxID=1963835 RepID=A0A212REM9_9PROT|nr:ABC transporter substrate-binding protein [Arboricoccus pini]SNB70819.1 peptide/nickel transport system substrate-binding protein [Arboricoccus pini]